MYAYRKEVLRTANRDYGEVQARLSEENLRLLNAGLGLAGEGGEFADRVKKIIFHGNPLDEAERVRLLSELGDIRWYFELALDVLGTTMAEIEAMNVGKLRKRFPEGFSETAAQARKDVEQPTLP